MEILFDWLRPILSGLIGSLVGAWLLFAFLKEKGEVREGVRVLSYSKPFKIFSALLVPFAVFVIYAASQACEEQRIPAFIVASFFGLSAIFFPYQAFFISFRYDDDYIYYKSPLVGKKKVPWSHLEEIGYSWLAQSDYIVVRGIGKIWCSNMLNGYPALGEFLYNKINELFP